MNEELNSHGNTILKELSDIKASLAVNTAETANVKTRVTEMQVDIKDMRNDVITRREFSENITSLKNEITTSNSIFSQAQTDHENRIRSIERFKWQIIGGLVVVNFLSDYVLYLVLKR